MDANISSSEKRPENPSQAMAGIPSVAPATERKSEHVTFLDYAKVMVMAGLVLKLSSMAGGFLAGRYLPSSVFPKKWQPVIESTGAGMKAAVGSAIAGTGAAIYQGWKHWRTGKARQLGVNDISKDIYTELDPKLLQAELEQNQRIQDGITALTRNISPREAITPRGSHTQEALKEDPATAISR